MHERPVPPRWTGRSLAVSLAWAVLLGLASWSCGGGASSSDVVDGLPDDGQGDGFADAPLDQDDEGPLPLDPCPRLPDGTPCDDRDPCTSEDACLAGTCVGTPNDCSWRDGPCTTGTCQPPFGECVALPVDDGTACDDGDDYTEGEACLAGACEGGWALSCHGTLDGTACDDGDPCTEDDRCGASQCQGVPLADGTACDDHDACTTGDVCLEGQCRANTVDCSGLVTPCAAAACEPATGACQVQPHPDGGTCDDGDACTTEDACLGGLCLGVDRCVCEGEPDGTACDDNRACTEDDACVAGLCQGRPITCAASTDPCQARLCVEVQGGCASQPLPNGTPCDDADPCTPNDTCQDGACVGTVNTCFCADKPDGTGCDDGNPCTLGDACLNEECTGTPRDCTASGDGVCIEGVCDTADGSCVATARPNGSPCDDGLLCTQDDVCTFGTCLGSPLSCPGDACNEGGCDPSTGACGFVPSPKGTPCDDGLVCTGKDGCDGGVCTGTVSLCTPCADAQAADACDDGDACTVDTRCSPTSVGLACLGTAVDCSHLDDACTVRRCDPADGTCSLPLDRPDGTPCDDGDPCTAGDACSAGTCAGTAVGTCGATFGGCEPAGDHASAAGAASLALEDGASTLLGFIDPPGDEDWYVVHLEAKQRLTLATRPHCGSALDTRLGLVAPDGTSLLADDDNGGGGGWSTIDGFEVPASGDYFVVVNAFPSSGAGSYLLVVNAVVPACETDADCGCTFVVCAQGTCVPAVTGEVEPNDDSNGANPLTYGEGAAVQGDLSTLTDEDWFAVSLPASTTLALTATPLCQSGVQLHLSLYADDGVTLVAEGVAGSDAASARLDGLYLSQATALRALVTGLNASLGAYVLSVTDVSCHVAADCQCADQVCGNLVEGKGQCLPALASAETADGSAVALELDQRLHGRIDPAYDEDRFTIFLAQGTYDLRTVAYCGSDVDTLLEVRDTSGTLLASNDDADQGLFAGVSGLSLAQAATLTLRVSGRGAATGDYLVVVSPTVVP